MKLISVNYHYIRPCYEGEHPGIQGILPDQFEDQLSLLSGIGDFVSGEDIDDGLREQYDWAWPVLRRKRVPALFFINSGPIENQKVSTVHKVHLLRSQMTTEIFLSKLMCHAAELGIPLDSTKYSLASSVR
jgi:hypothetical protein